MLFKLIIPEGKHAIPRSVASGCGVIVLAAVQFNRQPIAQQAKSRI
jgi:hypothetical protein